MQGVEEPEVQELEIGCKNMSLEADEEIGVDLPDETEELAAKIDLQHAMVGRFLTDKHIKFDYMQQVLASVWRPVMGMRIKEIRPNLYIFQFFHEKDISRVLDRGPWGFENYTLVCKRLGANDIPKKTVLFFLDIWVQIFDLPCGYISERIAGLIGNHLGTFISNDPNNFVGGWRNYLRIRVSIDVRLPLKRRMKLKKKDGACFWVVFKYERLHTFCYYCGILGHSMQFCRTLYGVETMPEKLPYGAWLRASLRQQENLIGSRWIVEEGCSGRSEPNASDDQGDIQNGDEGSSKNSDTNPLRGIAPNSDTLEESPPTLDYKRRRSSPSALELQNNLRHRNIDNNFSLPASSAKQARPTQ